MKRKSRNITKKLEPYVLFIEDEDDIRDAVVMSFIGRGCKIVSAPDRQSALEQMRHIPNPPDVVVSDFHLGSDETGLEVIDSVRLAVGSAIPGVLISGDTSPATLQALYSSGIAVLHKPVRFAELRQTIEGLGVTL